MVCSTDRFKAVVPVLVLLVYSTRRFVLCLALCYFVFVFFSRFSIAVNSLGDERASRCFSYGGSICACLVLSVSFSSWCLGRAAVCDCGTPWTFLLPVFLNLLIDQNRKKANQNIGICFHYVFKHSIKIYIKFHGLFMAFRSFKISCIKWSVIYNHLLAFHLWF